MMLAQKLAQEFAQELAKDGTRSVSGSAPGSLGAVCARMFASMSAFAAGAVVCANDAAAPVNESNATKAQRTNGCLPLMVLQKGRYYDTPVVAGLR